MKTGHFNLLRTGESLDRFVEFRGCLGVVQVFVKNLSELKTHINKR
jgi:hypothetical protein